MDMALDMDMEEEEEEEGRLMADGNHCKLFHENAFGLIFRFQEER